MAQLAISPKAADNSMQWLAEIVEVKAVRAELDR